MGQESNSRRNASLDEKKQRAAGRAGRTGQYAPGRDPAGDPLSAEWMKGKTGGAFGGGEESAKERKKRGRKRTG
jgi:hypothetical protein